MLKFEIKTNHMEKKYFLLSSVEKNRLIKIFQIIFGIACFSVAVFWLIYSIKSIKISGTPWITVIFLAGFGFYQVWAGLGQTIKFIEISSDKIRLKKFIFLPAVELSATELQKIELYPFNIIFFLKAKRRIMLRFGTTYYETNEKIKDEMLSFADLNAINIELMKEKL
jgi:hypothetical protein